MTIGVRLAVLAAMGVAVAATAAENTTMFRGEKSGMYEAKGLPTEWSEKDGKNILWSIKTELQGWASPVVFGGKVILTAADKEKRAVLCIDAANGKVLWRTEVPALEGAEEVTMDTMDERWNGLLWAGATPAVNGKLVFAAFSSGQLVAVKLEDGAIAWNQGVGSMSGNTYGWDNSLLVDGDNVIAVFEGDKKFVACYEGATGKELWKTERKSSTWSSPILMKTSAGKTLVVVSADPDTTAWDAKTGAKVWSVDALTASPEYCVGPSPVAVGDMVYVNSQNSGIVGIDAVKGTKVWSKEELPDGAGFADGTSMVSDGKNVYQYYSGFLSCLDGKTGEVVKQVEMADEANYASPFFCDGKLYLFGGGGVSVRKADPSADFPEVGQGKLKDSGDASPAVVDGKIFIRTGGQLYCIGTK